MSFLNDSTAQNVDAVSCSLGFVLCEGAGVDIEAKKDYEDLGVVECLLIQLMEGCNGHSK